MRPPTALVDAKLLEPLWPESFSHSLCGIEVTTRTIWSMKYPSLWVLVDRHSYEGRWPRVVVCGYQDEEDFLCRHPRQEIATKYGGGV
eukprot:123288-Amphidinium_carterae.1